MIRIVAIASAAITPLVSAQDTSVVVTRHTSHAAGRALSYTAQAGRLPMRAMNAEEPHAYMFYVAYRMPSAPGSSRPITFMWGGGPSSSGLGTHMEFGPKRVVGGKIQDNDLTLLTVSDLVIIDPVGTGFSRPTKPEYGAEFYNVLGDQASLAEFIRVWRAKYDAAEAPIFLWGVSYGTWRVSGVAELLEKAGVRVAGAILNSGGIQLGPDALPRELVIAHRTPGRAATAFAHHKLAADVGATLEDVRRNAERWAVDVYAPALARVASLSDAERESIAAQLSRYTGYPVEKIDRKTLSFSPREFLNGGLLPGQNLSNYDGRIVAPAVGSGGGGRAAGSVAASGGDARVRYLRDELGYRTDLAYLGVESGYMPTPGPAFAGPAPWDYNSAKVTPEMIAAAQAGEGPPGTDAWLRRALDLDPRLKVFVAAGVYDSFNSCSGNEDVVRRLGALAGNFTLRCYLGGHGVREGDTQPRFAADLRSFLVSTLRSFR